MVVLVVLGKGGGRTPVTQTRRFVRQSSARRNSLGAAIVVVAALASALLSSCSAPTNVERSPSAAASPSATPQTREQMLDDLWKYYLAAYPDAERPDDVTFVRYVQQNEWAAIQADCLHGEGFPDVSATPDGGVASGDVPESQAEVFQVANYVCNAEYPLDPKYSVPLTDERLGALYDYYVNDLAPCLENHGYPVTSAPSKSTFVGNYFTEGWTPYGVDFAGTQDEWYQINEACPQWPADFYG